MKKRTSLYEKIQQMWTDEVPTTTIFQGTLYLFAQKNIRGILLSPTLQFNYGPIHKVK
jgi:ABC-type transport system substrate-binding protein